MSARRATGLLAALLLLAAPSAALADGAGDQQYQDPLTAPSTPHKQKRQKKPVARTAPAAAAPTMSRSSQPAATHAPATTRRAELPRTGAPAGLIALAGALMIAAGLALRRHTATT